MRGKQYLLCILVFFMCVYGFAGDDQVLSGYIQSEILVPAGWGDLYYLDLSTRMLLNVNYTGSSAKLFGEVFFNVDDLTGTGDYIDKLSLEPGEMYLSLFMNKTDITVGYQIISWGAADGINPTNNINPQDLSDPLKAIVDSDSVTIPVNAVRINFYPADFLNFEGVFVPVFTRPGMPDISSYLPSELSGVSIDFTYPDTELGSFEAGVKANFILPGIDFSLSYLYAWDDIPDIKVNIIQQEVFPMTYMGVPASMDFTFNRVHIIGADYAWPVFDIDFRGEAAFFITEDTSGDDVFIKNPYLYYVVGAGYTFLDSLQVNLQFSQKYVTNFQKVSDYDYTLDPMDPEAFNQSDEYYEEAYTTRISPLTSLQKGEFISSLMLVISKKFFDDLLETSVVAMYNFPEDYDDNETDEKYGDYMIRPAVAYQFTDAFDVEIGANLFFSAKKDSNGDFVRDPYTNFGMLDDKDCFYLNLKYSY